jgi:hypothetical protein
MATATRTSIEQDLAASFSARHSVENLIPVPSSPFGFLHLK